MSRFSVQTMISWASLLLALELVQARDQQIRIDPDSFAAVAYSPTTGEVRYAANYGGRAAAEQAALRACQAKDARIVGWVNNGFFALAVGKDHSAWGFGTSYGDGARSKDAERGALEECNKRTSGAGIILVIASDG